MPWLPIASNGARPDELLQHRIEASRPSGHPAIVAHCNPVECRNLSGVSGRSIGDRSIDIGAQRFGSGSAWLGAGASHAWKSWKATKDDCRGRSIDRASPSHMARSIHEVERPPRGAQRRAHLARLALIGSCRRLSADLSQPSIPVQYYEALATKRSRRRRGVVLLNRAMAQERAITAAGSRRPCVAPLGRCCGTAAAKPRARTMRPLDRPATRKGRADAVRNSGVSTPISPVRHPVPAISEPSRSEPTGRNVPPAPGADIAALPETRR
jgi:hypothetical protein